jgi:hypothetical protein
LGEAGTADDAKKRAGFNFKRNIFGAAWQFSSAPKIIEA